MADFVDKTHLSELLPKFLSTICKEINHGKVSVEPQVIDVEENNLVKRTVANKLKEMDEKSKKQHDSIGNFLYTFSFTLTQCLGQQYPHSTKILFEIEQFTYLEIKLKTV